MTTQGDGPGDMATPLTRRSRLADLAEEPVVPVAADATPRVDRDFAARLGEFRRTAVLVPLAPEGGAGGSGGSEGYGGSGNSEGSGGSGGPDGLWTAEHGGVRWICAFSDEAALARFARARGEADRAWEYRTVLGARLLDVMVPLVDGPAGVALDAGGDDGMVFPPVEGVVPDSAAVDLGGTE
ncbi:SseB family protein [Streptomyces coeruleoprunus]|uniref:SseB family protein n=1 Tax=Streptomyces coeruleoprunus TaxID=285563 RepID=A0ABV9XII7_9ACTN